jgi:uncharacterized protein YndB with AHSA1/START domain
MNASKSGRSPKDARDASNVIHIRRVYNASVKRVWDAWVLPEQVGEWWGPRGFTLTTRAKDVRVGGTWNYVMHGPDGVDYENRTTFLEVVPYEKLVYDHGANEEQGPMFRVSVTFTETDGKTTMDMQMILPTPEDAKRTRGFVKQAGGNATWDRLGEFLEKRASDKELFVINRSFDAPIEVLFEMWTNPKHMAVWTPPVGYTMEFLRADVRTGGSSFYRMTNGSDVTMYATASYLEVDAPKRLVYVQRFVDADEKVSRHPLAPTWPESMMTIVEFTPEGPNETRVTLTWEPHGACTREELASFVAARMGMTGGWTGSFDKLEAQLAAQST